MCKSSGDVKGALVLLCFTQQEENTQGRRTVLTCVKIKIQCTQELWNSSFIPHCIWTYMQVQIREMKIIVESLNGQISQPPIFTKIYLMSRNTNIPIKLVWNTNLKKLNGVRSVGSFPMFAVFSLRVWQRSSLSS